MPDQQAGGLQATFQSLGVFLMLVIILRFGADVLVPIATAALLAFLLSPVAIRLARWGMGRTLAVVVTATFAFIVIGTVAWAITNQALDLVQALPNYERNIDAKIHRLRAPHAAPALDRVEQMFDRLQQEFSTPSKAAALPNGQVPVPVEVRTPQHTTWGVFRQIALPALEPFGTALIVIVFVVAILLQREDLRDRFLRVMSTSRLNVATQAVNDATQRVSHYLGMQLLVNSAYGCCIGLGLHFIGTPSPLLWGLLATMLRFVPFVGPWIAAAGPLVLAIAIDPGWTKLALTFGLYAGMEFVTANLVEVVVYGASTGLSPIAVMVAAVFWTWLWGPAGLFLSTPLTVCLLVLGRYVPALAFLDVMLGSQPALSPAAQFYHRMLAMDSEEMVDTALKYLETFPLATFYDDVFVPALIMAETDRHRGTLADTRQRFIFEASKELIEELENRRRRPARRLRKGAAALQAPEEPSVLGVAVSDDADEIAALMLRHLLRERGIAAAVCPVAMSPAALDDIASSPKVSVVFVSAVPPSALAPARQATRRLREGTSDVKIVAGVWAPEGDVNDITDRLAIAEPDGVALSLVDAAAQIEKMLGAAKPETPSPPAAGAAAAK